MQTVSTTRESALRFFPNLSLREAYNLLAPWGEDAVTHLALLGTSQSG